MDSKRQDEEKKRELDVAPQSSVGFVEFPTTSSAPEVFRFRDNFNQDKDHLSETRAHSWPMSSAETAIVPGPVIQPVASSDDAERSSEEETKTQDSGTKIEPSPSKRSSRSWKNRSRSRTQKKDGMKWAKSPAKERRNLSGDKRKKAKKCAKSDVSEQSVESSLLLKAVKSDDSAKKDYFGNPTAGKAPTVDVSFDSSGVKMASPASSITSNKRGLEWDSGADVGYRFQEPASPLSTLDRLALERGTAALQLGKCSLPASDDYQVSGGEPLAQSTPLEVPRKSATESHLAEELNKLSLENSECQLKFIVFPQRKSSSSSLSSRSSKSSEHEENSPVTILRPAEKKPTPEQIQDFIARIERNARIHESKISELRLFNTYPGPRSVKTVRQKSTQTDGCDDGCSSGKQSASSGTSPPLDGRNSNSSCDWNDTPRTTEQGTIGSAGSFEYLPGHVYETSRVSDPASSTDSKSLERAARRFNAPGAGPREREELCRNYAEKLLARDDSESSLTAASVVFVAGTSRDKATQVRSVSSACSSGTDWKRPATKSEQRLAVQRHLEAVDRQIEQLLLRRRTLEKNLGESSTNENTAHSQGTNSSLRSVSATKQNTPLANQNTGESQGTNSSLRSVSATKQNTPLANQNIVDSQGTNSSLRSVSATKQNTPLANQNIEDLPLISQNTRSINKPNRKMSSTNQKSRPLHLSNQSRESMSLSNQNLRSVPKPDQYSQFVQIANQNSPFMSSTIERAGQVGWTNGSADISSSEAGLDHQAHLGRINVFAAAGNNNPDCCCKCDRKLSRIKERCKLLDERSKLHPASTTPTSDNSNPMSVTSSSNSATKPPVVYPQWFVNTPQVVASDKRRPVGYLLTLESDETTLSDATDKHSLPEVKVKLARRNKQPRRHVVEVKEKLQADARLTLQECLRLHRPDFVSNADKRRECLSELSALRCLRHEARQRLAALSTHPGAHLPLHPLAVKRVFSQRSMLKQNKALRKNCSEAVNKRAEMKRKEDYRTNRLMAEIFTRNLQRTVLKGAVNLSNSVSVISTLR